jgi:hypothetical protein
MDCAPLASRRLVLGNGKDSYTLRLTRLDGNWAAAKMVQNGSCFGLVLTVFQSGFALNSEPERDAIDSYRMNANDFGKRLGIGVRVAGRMAGQAGQQRSQQPGPSGSVSPAQAANASGAVYEPKGVVEMPSQRFVPTAQEILAAKQKTHKYTRAAGRGIGGLLRPFGRVGGILWLEVTGVFFGMFMLLFATDAWRSRTSYAAGPLHQRFLIAAGLTLVFGYLSVSAFWRAKRR